MRTFKKETLFQILFFLSFGLYILSVMLEATTFSNHSFFLQMIVPLRKLSWLLAGIKIAAKGLWELASKKYTLRWFSLFFFAGMALCFYYSRSHQILSLSLLILAANGISFKKIAAASFFAQGIIMILTFSAYFWGKIPGVDVGDQQSWGYNSPNCLMLVAFHLIFLYSYLRKDRVRWYDFLGMGLFGTAIFYISGGRIGYFCTLLALLSLWLYRYGWMERLLERFRLLFKPFAVILALLFLGLTIVAWEGELIFLQNLTTWRLYFAYMALFNIGLTAFGQQIPWMGQRGANLGDGYNYNYVDSSYAKGLLDFGVIPMALFMIASYQQKSMLYRKKEYLLLLFTLIIEIYCFFESFWIPPIYNTTMLLMKDTLYPLKQKE